MNPKRKSGRPLLDENSATVSVGLPKELHEAIMAIAKKCYLDRGSTVRLLLSEAVEARKRK